jgi:hypothetical protein
MPDWIMRIFIGLLVMGLGVLFAFKTEWFLRMLGRVDFAERVFGGGGTRFFYKLLGVFFCVIGILLVTNLFGNFMLWLFGGLFGT